jgi:hypothetical protein
VLAVLDMATRRAVPISEAWRERLAGWVVIQDTDRPP